ncbi:MAG: hypothetical protein HOE75_02370 [Chloroflexi bacterium]|jgi:hypothetical protein|nr:hypothetical protein [Chloroflexota bacterium]
MSRIAGTYRSTGLKVRASLLVLPARPASALPDALSVNLSTGPGAILADGGLYETLFLRLEDEAGLPFPFPENTETEVSLWTSDPELFTVQPTVIVPRGSVAISIPVRTTLKAGTGTITAAVKNEGAASVQLQTVSSTGAVPPFSLQLELAPPIMPEGSTQPGRFVVSLRGAQGAPVVAPISTNVAITSSRPGFAAPTESTYVIPAGANAVFGEYVVGDKGEAIITAQANGFLTDSSTVTITEQALHEVISDTPVAEDEDPIMELVETLPTDLAVYVVPDRFLPGDSSALVVAQALTAGGIPTNFTCNAVRVTTDVIDGIRVRQGAVAVPEGLDCGVNASYASGTVDSTGSPSPTQITITQSGVTGTTVTATAHTRSVDAFDLKFAYPTSSAGDSASNFIIARLLDASGAPAPAPSETPLFLFSEAVDVPASASFLPGESHKSFPMMLRGGGGTINVSGVLPGTESVVAEMEVVEAALRINVSLNPSTIAIGQSTVVDALVTLGDRPVGGAALIWQTTSGELLNPPAVTDQTGRGSAEFIPLDAESQVTVSANFGGVSSSGSPVQAQVITSFDGSRGLPSLTIIGITIPLSLMLTLFVILLAVYLGYRFLPGTSLAARANELYENALSRFRSPEEAPETVQETVDAPENQGN